MPEVALRGLLLDEAEELPPCRRLRNASGTCFVVVVVVVLLWVTMLSADLTLRKGASFLWCPGGAWGMCDMVGGSPGFF